MQTHVSGVPNAPKEKFPLVRRTLDDDDPIVVLFTSEFEGVVLSTGPVATSRVGKFERSWISCYDTKAWAPCSITLSSLGC